MVEITCPSCGSRLQARDDLAGQVRRCPKCRTPIQIPAVEEPISETVTLVEVPEEQVPHEALEPLPHIHPPEKILAPNRYLICDNTKLIAVWQADGRGWLLKTHAGLVPALQNMGEVPVEGDFKLIELRLKSTDAGLRLDSITSYQLAHRFALRNLSRSDHEILHSITDPGRLNRDQKFIVRQAIREQFMPDVWSDSKAVLDYLGNADYHSPGSAREA